MKQHCRKAAVCSDGRKPVAFCVTKIGQPRCGQEDEACDFRVSPGGIVLIAKAGEQPVTLELTAAHWRLAPLDPSHPLDAGESDFL